MLLLITIGFGVIFVIADKRIEVLEERIKKLEDKDVAV